MVPRKQASISPTWLTWARRFAALLLLAFAWNPAAHAQNASTWTGGLFLTGSWGLPENWFPTGVPTAANNTLINTSNGYVEDNITFIYGTPFISGTDPNGGNFSVNSLILADNSSIIATVNYPFLTINASGLLTDNSSIIGNISGQNTTGNVTVSDSGTVWTTIGNISVGDNGGSGVLNVNNLGLVVAGNITASTNTAGGNIGVGAVVLNSGIIQTNGTLQINNAGNATIPTIDFSYDPVNGDSVSIFSNIPNGLQGSGTLIGNVSCDGLLTPSGGTIPSGLLTFDNNLALTSNAILTFSLTGLARATQYSAIDVAGNLSVNGTLSLQLSNGYVPSDGNVFALMQLGGVTSGNFSNVTVPALPGGLGWDLSNLTVNGTVTVIPVFTTQPANSTVVITQNTTFTVATNLPSPIFQWQTSTNKGLTWANVTNGPIFNGTTNATLTHHWRHRRDEQQPLPRHHHQPQWHRHQQLRRPHR